MAFTTERKFIQMAEERLGRKLPAGLIERLLRENGGSIEADGEAWTLHPVFDDSDRRRATRTADDMVRATQAAKAWREFPLDAVSVAENGTGDLLILLPSADQTTFDGTVFVWEHETGDVRPIADRFEDLTGEVSE
jgi:hypothetical protein